MNFLRKNVAEFIFIIGIILILSVLYSFNLKLGVFSTGILFVGAGIFIGEVL